MIHQFWAKHKKASMAIVAMALVVVWYGYKSLTAMPAQITYVLAQVTKGTLITSVSGSGQVSSSNQIDIKAKASGDILKVNVIMAQEVKSGAALVGLDPRDALKTLRDAQTSLTSARLSLQKLKKPATDYALLQGQNAVTSAQISLDKLKLSQKSDQQKAEQAKTKADDDLAKAYEDAYNMVDSTFQDLPTIMTGLDNMLYSEEISANESSIGKNQENSGVFINTVSQNSQEDLQKFLDSAQKDYQVARVKYDSSFVKYKNSTRYADSAAIEILLNDTFDTSKAIAQASKSESNLMDKWVDLRTRSNWTILQTIKGYQTNLATFNSQLSSHLSSLLASQGTLQDGHDAKANAEINFQQIVQNGPLDLKSAKANLNEKVASLANLRADADPLDIQSQELSIQQSQNNLTDATEKLSDYTIRAPFDGTIAAISLKKGDSLSSGTVAATLITHQRIAQISLNEVDAAKIKVGQKATLTFDAVDGLSISGEISEVDTLGVVSQGVVTYGVKISFDTQDDRIKSGMSVSASIITEAKQDALIVPNAAVKTQGTESYVEVPNETIPATAIKGNSGVALATPPRQQTVTVGLSNDTSTEITVGLNEGDVIVVRTAAATTAKPATGTSLFQVPRGVGGGGRGG